ncbi:hypothetical protein [Acidisphaera sp. S103]|uniref:hypothetical protein n=1 Tax=Acidisphaera sp. S103 TaxID=1747223 RepID=UPI00131DD817|nr:hypothetical protein [Acidisphaera sp. S103]
MLAGEAVVAIWNGIAPEARDQFYDWHINEYMPERVGIPGFRRGRRYIAADPATHPEFFTLYELDTMEVAKGSDYANRLNDPTPGTVASTSQFRDTFRALSRVLLSEGPGAGGAILTIRLDFPDSALGDVRAAVSASRALPRVTGVHLCQGDAAASAVRTTETKGRTDIQEPPSRFIMVEATDAAALAPVLPASSLPAASAIVRGIYRLEYTRTKTAFAP